MTLSYQFWFVYNMKRNSAVATWRHKVGIKRRDYDRDKAPGNAQYILGFLILLLTAGVSVGKELLTALNFDADYLAITLIAIVVSFLTANRNFLFIVLVVGMSLAVNIPEEILHDIGLNKTILLVTLIAIILEPFFKKLI